MFRLFSTAVLALLMTSSFYDFGYSQANTPTSQRIIKKLLAPDRAPAANSRKYSIREIKRNRTLRYEMPSIDIQTINFRFGSAEIPRSEFWKIQEIATALGYFLQGNRDELFLLEGHTDAVGSRQANYRLSVRRAHSLRRILIRHFGIDPYALHVEGYGEDYLIVYTQAPEWRNRRVTLRRLTGYARR